MLFRSINTAIQLVAENAQAGTRGADAAAEVARTGAQIVDGNVRRLGVIKTKLARSADKVREMGDRSVQVGQIIEKIDEIASQTNLLALNAAIEAARGGQQGKGFAVVAGEVRKLAVKTAAEAQGIATLVKSIQASVAEAVSAMSETTQEVENGVKGAGRAGQALADISQSVESVRAQVESISGAAEGMRGSASELVEAMENVSAVVEQNSAATEEMAAGSNEVGQAIEHIAGISEEMNAQVSEVSTSARAVSEMAETLQLLSQKFKLDTRPDLPIIKPKSLPKGRDGEK